MKTISFGTAYRKPVVLALGFFDSMHVGHQHLIAKAKELSVARGCETAIFTFCNNPSVFFRPTKLVYTLEERLERMQQFGVDVVFSALFDETFKNKTAQEFLQDLSQYRVQALVCGFDYTFGKGAEGTVGTLRDYAKQNGIALYVLPEVLFYGQKAGSTLVKKLIQAGEMEKVSELLGGDYFLSGTVEHGRAIGRTMGLPTANLSRNDEKQYPAAGVYAGTASVDGQTYRCVINVGPKPTFAESSETIEAHLIGFEGNLYGKKIRLYFHRKLREIRRFASAEALEAQILQDISEAQK